MIQLKTNSGCPDHDPDTAGRTMTMRGVAAAAEQSADASEDRMTAIEDRTILCDVLVYGRDQNQARGPCPAP